MLPKNVGVGNLGAVTIKSRSLTMACCAIREPGGSVQTRVMDSSPPRAWGGAVVGAGGISTVTHRSTTVP